MYKDLGLSYMRSLRVVCVFILALATFACGGGGGSNEVDPLEGRLIVSGQVLNGGVMDVFPWANRSPSEVDYVVSSDDPEMHDLVSRFVTKSGQGFRIPFSFTDRSFNIKLITTDKTGNSHELTTEFFVPFIHNMVGLHPDNQGGFFWEPNHRWGGVATNSTLDTVFDGIRLQGAAATISHFFLHRRHAPSSIPEPRCFDWLSTPNAQAVLAYQDADKNHEISPGDIYTVNYSDCVPRIKIISSGYGRLVPISGEIEVLVDAFDADLGFRARVTFRQFRVHDEGRFGNKTFDGVMFVSLDYDNFSQSWQVSSGEEGFRVMNSNRYAANFTNFSTRYHQDFRAASYEASFEQKIEVGESHKTIIELQQIEPLAGRSSQAPSAGSWRLTTSNDESIDIRAQSGDLFFGLSDTSWYFSAEAWQMAGSSGADIVAENSLHRFVDEGLLVWGQGEVRSGSDVGVVGLNGGLIFAFSSELESIDVGEVFYRTGSAGIDVSIPAVAEIDGAILRISASEPLEPGRDYQLTGRYSVQTAEFTDSARSFDRFLSADASIIPMIDASSKYFDREHTPQLDASASVVAEGELQTYEWIDVDEVGITFEDKYAAATSFSLPDAFDADEVLIGLDVTSSLGKTVRKTVTLAHLVDVGSYMFFMGDDEDSYTNGEPFFEVINENSITAIVEWVKANNSVEHRETHALSVKSVIENHDYTYENRPHYWSIEVSAPTDTALTNRLYDNADGFSSARTNENPGIFFFSNYRSSHICYEEKDQGFEVLELTYDAEGNVESLALDFWVNCNLQYSDGVVGVLRFNSSVSGFARWE